MIEDLGLDDDNILRADRGLFRPDGQSFVSIRCPHCRERGIFEPVTGMIGYRKSALYGSSTESFLMAVRQCPNNLCSGLVATVSQDDEVVVSMPPEVIDFDAAHLPNTLLQTLTEAIQCHAAGAYRASAMMVRRLLEEICEDSGATGKDLHHRLQDLRSKIILPEELFEAMSELKAIGNDAAHIEAKQYDRIEKDEAEDTIELAKEILKARYQLKGLVARLQARKKK